LFAGLDHAQREIILDAMYQKEYKNGEYVIQQGQPGNNFYILSSGEAECFVQKKDDPPSGQDLQGRRGVRRARLDVQLATSRVNPRQGRHPSLGHGSATFRRVLMDTTSEKRTLYEGFLGSVQILGSLDRNEIAKVPMPCRADVRHRPNMYPQDEQATTFTCRRSEARATKSCWHRRTQRVMRYRPGDYFGELALLTTAACRQRDRGRPAKVVTLDRASFVRLLGPCDEILNAIDDLCRRRRVAIP